MTLALYARKKGWSLDGVTVRLSHSRVHAQDCADCETKEGKIDQIERELVLSGRLDETQRARLAQIADMCPVHRTLTSEVKIRTRLVGTTGAGGIVSRPPPSATLVRYGASVVPGLLSLESAHTGAVAAVSAANASRIANAMRFITSPPHSPIETQPMRRTVR